MTVNINRFLKVTGYCIVFTGIDRCLEVYLDEATRRYALDNYERTLLSYETFTMVLDLPPSLVARLRGDYAPGEDLS